MTDVDNFPKAPAPPEEPANKVSIRPLRTYEDDVKEAVRTQDLSSVRILLSEQRRREKETNIQEETSPKTPKNIFFIFLSILLVLAGLAAFFVPGFFKKDEEALPPISFRSKIGPEQKEFINTTNINNNEIVDSLAKEFGKKVDLPKNSVKEIVLTKTIQQLDEGGNMKKYRVGLSTEEFFKIVNTDFPSETIRSLGEEFSMGIWMGDKNYPFIVFEVKDFSLAFGKMLEKENEVARTFIWIFEKRDNILPPVNPSVSPVSTSSPVATSSVQTATSVSRPFSTTTGLFTNNIGQPTSTNQLGSSSKPDVSASSFLSDIAKREILRNFIFQDAIIKNKDLRILYNNNKKIIFFYGFVNNKKNLVLTNNGEAMDEIIRRVNSNSFIR